MVRAAFDSSLMVASVSRSRDAGGAVAKMERGGGPGQVLVSKQRGVRASAGALVSSVVGAEILSPVAVPAHTSVPEPRPLIQGCLGPALSRAMRAWNCSRVS